jgi:hypothetical protein
MNCRFPSFIGVALGFIAFLVMLIAMQPGAFLPPLASLLAVGGVVALVTLHGRFAGRSRREEDAGGLEQAPVPFTTWAALVALAVVCVSPAVTDPFFHLVDWPARSGNPMRGLAFRWMLATLIAAVLLGWRPPLSKAVLCLLFPVAVLLALNQFGRMTEWTALYNTDHPSFMHRFWLLARSFPMLVYYDPTWNGGGDAVFSVASAAWLPGTFFALAQHMGEMTSIYTPTLAFVYIVFIPAIIFAVFRGTGFSAGAACMAAVLSMGVSWGWFKHLLHFGTLGATLAVSFILPAWLYLERILTRSGHRRGNVIALAVFTSLFLAWPGHWSMAFLLLIPLLVTMVGFRAKPAVLGDLVCTGILVILFTMPVWLTVLVRVDITGFARHGALQPVHAGFSFSDGWKTLGGHLRETHPLLLCAGMLAAAWRGGVDRSLTAFSCLVLLVFASWGKAFFPAFETHRAAYVAAFIAVLPAVRTLTTLWCQTPRSHGSALRNALVVGLLFASLYNTAGFYGKRPHATYRTLPSSLRDQVDWMVQHTQPDARIMIAGHASHAFGGGKAAFLPMLTGRQMIAADYYEFSSRRVEKFQPPRFYRQSHAHAQEYMRLFNIGYVVVWDMKGVGNYYQKYPEFYRQVSTSEGPHPKTLFEVLRTPSWFLENAGTVEASVNRLHVTIANPELPAVICYRWSPNLHVNAPARLEAFVVDEHTSLIRIHPEGQPAVQIIHRALF